MGRTHANGVESTAAVFHHPIHPMLIAFPMATLIGAPLADVAAITTRDPFWSRTARLLLVSGLASGVAASAAGLVDYLSIKQVRRLPSAHVHAGGNALALALVGLNLSRRGNADRDPSEALDLALSLTTVALLGVTAWLGGELSYRQGVGVIAQESPTASETITALGRRLGGARRRI